MQTLIGWTGVIIASAVLLASGYSVIALRRMDPGSRVRVRPIRTTYLLAMWLVLLIGSAGLLADAGWAKSALRGWAAMAAGWTLLYVGASLNSVYGLDEAIPGAFRRALSGMMVVLLLVGSVITLLLIGLARVPS